MFQIRQRIIEELFQCEEVSAEAEEVMENVEAELDSVDNACAKPSIPRTSTIKRQKMGKY